MRLIMSGILLLSALSLTMVYSQSVQLAENNSVRKAERVSHLSQQNQEDGGPLVEEWSFVIKDFKVDHQTESNNLNINVSYRYVMNIANSEYPDFRLLAKDVEVFLTTYPEEADYWEIVNKKATSLLLKKYPALARITIDIKVDPTPLDPYTRSSRVTRQRTAVSTNRRRR